jgi:tetratricopeptide (TPR) repeat protein
VKLTDNFTEIKGISNLVIMVTLVLAIGFVFACTSATTTAKNQNGAENTVSAEEAAKAAEREAKSYEMLKQYNFGNPPYMRGDYEKALPMLHKVRVLDTDLNGADLKYPEIYQKIGMSYRELGKQDSALYYFEEGIKLLPDNLWLHENVAYYYKAVNRLDDYIAEVHKIIALLEEPEDIKKWKLILIDYHVQSNEFDQAIKLYDELIVLEPDNREFIDNRLNLLRASGGSEQIRKEYEEHHQQYPNDKDTIGELIVIYVDAAEHEKVIEMVDKFLALQPGDIESIEKKIHALKELGRESETINTLNQIASLVPDDPKYFVEIAEIHINAERFSQGVTFAEKALNVRSGYGEAHFQIARSFFQCANNVKNSRANSRTKYEDKLVYKMALLEYEKAAKDPNKKADAERWINHIKVAEYEPTSEDQFMNRTVTKPQDPGYAWLQKYYTKYKSQIIK